MQRKYRSLGQPAQNVTLLGECHKPWTVDTRGVSGNVAQVRGKPWGILGSEVKVMCQMRIKIMSLGLGVRLF